MIRKIKNNPPLMVCLSFFGLILFGAILLNLPLASADGVSIGFLNALFTSTSASCVTGLIVANTATQWTVFGKLVIITLIQIGGLGTMVFLSLIALVLNKKIGITQRRIIKEQTNADTSKGIIRLVIYIIKFSLSVELIGAILLATRFIPDFGLKRGIFFSLFHAVSAFCNAGFDIIGNSIVDYVDNITVNLVIAFLIIFGGLGFTVYIDIYKKRRFKNLSLHSKVVISITAILLAVGTLAYFILEHKNGSMEGLTLKGKILASFFMSASARTAGFNTIDIAKMQEGSVIVTIILMFIGASPASTGGGIKTTTFGVLLFSTISVLRGNDEAEIFHKSISRDALLKSLCIFSMGSALVIFSSLWITIIEQGKFLYLDILYEIVSAIGTVGVTRGITPNLSPLSKLILIVLMYIGRVGAATLGISILNRKNKKHTRYSYGKIIVG